MAEPTTVSGDKASAFIDKLASDDAFRTKLKTDPVGALKDLGIELPRGTTIDPNNVTLPSKEEAAAAKAVPLKFAPIFGPGCPIIRSEVG
jgi:putative modified peptide